MNEVLNKLGIYDLVGVLLSGMIMSTFSIIIIFLMYDFSVTDYLGISETLVFLIVSYFIGMIFQELGAILQRKKFDKDKKWLSSILDTSKTSNDYLNNDEINGVRSYVNKKLKEIDNKFDTNNDTNIYYYCKSHIGDMSQIDKEQSLSAMSRSLYLYFAVLTFWFCVDVFRQPSLLKIVFIFVSLFFKVLFFQRCKRFTKLRYAYIIRKFYYDVVVK